MLTIEIYKTTANFSREFKYTLGEKLKNSAHDILDVIMRTNSMPDREKQKYFPEIDFKKENSFSRNLTAFSQDCGLLSDNSMIELLIGIYG